MPISGGVSYETVPIEKERGISPGSLALSLGGTSVPRSVADVGGAGMRLVLTSAGFENQAVADAFIGMLGKPAEVAKVLFIPTAAQSEEALYYVEKCKRELKAAGIHRDNLYIYDLDRRMEGEELRGYDAVYVCGGDTRHLLRRVKRVNLTELGHPIPGCTRGSARAASSRRRRWTSGE